MSAYIIITLAVFALVAIAVLMDELPLAAGILSFIVITAWTQGEPEYGGLVAISGTVALLLAIVYMGWQARTTNKRENLPKKDLTP